MRFAILGLMLLANLKMSAQNFLGTVEDVGGKPLVGATILLLDSVENILSYGISDAQGKWFIVCEKDGVKLQFNYLAHKELIYPVDKSNCNKPIAIRLAPLENLANEVVVTAERIMSIQKGDTTVYNVQYYRSETDQTFGDILSKLPGFEVNNEGQISYNGKRIDQILVEGKDILNNQHSFGTQGFMAGDIQKVEVIEHYKDFSEQFSQSWSDKVAINLLMNPSAKGAWRGNVELLAGYEKRYKAGLTLMNIKDNIAHTTFFRSNNLNEATIALQDFLTLQSALVRTLNQVETLSEIIPTGFERSENLQISQENLLASNTVYNIKKHTTAKLSILGNYFQRGQQGDVQRFYIPSADIFIGNQDAETNFQYFSSNINTQTTFGKKITLELDFPIVLDKTESNIITSGKLNKNTLDNYWNENKFNFKLNPQLYWNYKISSEHLIYAQLQYKYFQNNNELLIGGGNNLLFGILENNLFQESYGLNNSVNSILKWQYSRGSIKTQLQLSYQNIGRQIEQLDPFSITEKINPIFTSSKISPSFQISYEQKKILLQYSTEWAREYTSLSNQIADFNLWKNGLMAKYSFSKTHFVLLKGTAMDKLIDPIFSFQTYTFLNEYTLSLNNLAYPSLSQEKQLSLNYFRLNPRNAERFFTSLAYTRQNNPLILIFSKQESYIVQTPIISKYNIILNSRFWWATSFYNRQLGIKLEGGYRNSMNQIDMQSNIQLSGIEGIVRFKTNFKKSLNANISYIYSINQQKASILDVNFITQNLAGTVYYKKGNFYANADASLIFRTIRKEQQKFTILNTNLAYQLKSNWQVKVAIRDILNLNTQIVFNNTFNLFYQESTYYERFAGTIVLGVAKIFE